MIRVLVWAREAITRAGLEAIVEADPRFELARGARTPADLNAALRQFAPEVVLVDGSDIPVARLLSGANASAAADLPSPSVVALLEPVRRADIVRALQAGVRAVLARDAHPREITAALEAAHGGLAVFSPEFLDLLVPASAEMSGDGDLPPGEPLSERESEVLALMAEGAGNKEIAARLRISENTAKFHVSAILNKLGAATRTEAVTRGYKEGLILM